MIWPLNKLFPPRQRSADHEMSDEKQVIEDSARYRHTVVAAKQQELQSKLDYLEMEAEEYVRHAND